MGGFYLRNKRQNNLVKAHVFSVFVITLMLGACSSFPEVTPGQSSAFPHSMKGYELYSWQEKDEWHFTLITGTNRLKTLEEITTGESFIDSEGWVKISVTGVATLKNALVRLPAGEQIFWVGARNLSFDKLTLPPQAIIDDIQARCQNLGLDLWVTE